MWKFAASDAPLLTQVLFGETVRVLNRKNKHWVRVECTWDNTVGWMDPKQLYFLTDKQVISPGSDKHYSLELVYGIISDKISIPIVLGACLHNFDGINVKMPFGRFQFSGQAISPTGSSLSTGMFIKLCYKFLNAPEMRGGRSILGIDSAALAQLVYRLLNVDIPRMPHEQSLAGDDIGFIEQAKIGDLAFFCKRNGLISHVGLVIGPMSVMHAYGRVKIDRLDQQGIYDLEEGRYTYKLRTVRRLVELIDPEENSPVP